MANRSYLYSTNARPETDARQKKQKLNGISEWKYAVPLVYKLLLSANPRACRSFIWDEPGPIALFGDYDAGVERLTEFLSRVTHPAAANLKDEALGFLLDEKQRGEYFVLECGEVFEMGDEPIASQNGRLLDDLRDLTAQVEAALRRVNEPPISEQQRADGWWSKLFGKGQPPKTTADERQRELYALGLGNWVDVLYFDFGEER